MMEQTMIHGGASKQASNQPSKSTSVSPWIIQHDWALHVFVLVCIISKESADTRRASKEPTELPNA